MVVGGVQKSWAGYTKMYTQKARNVDISHEEWRCLATIFQVSYHHLNKLAFCLSNVQESNMENFQMNRMRNVVTACYLIGTALLIGCEGDGPFEPGILELEQETGVIAAESGLYADGAGYSSGLQQSDEITLRWSDQPNSEFLAYMIYANNWLIFQSDNSDLRSYTHDDLQEDETYEYRIERVLQNGMHDSAEIDIKTARWDAPGAVSISALDSNMVRVTWEDNSDNESHFTVALNLWDAEQGEYIADQELIVPANSEEVIYEISILDDFYFSVIAVSDFEDELISESDVFEIQFDNVSQLRSNYIFAENNIRLTWIDESNVESYYFVDRYDNGTWVRLAELAENSTEYYDSELSGYLPGDLLSYRVRAFSDMINDSTGYVQTQCVLRSFEYYNETLFDGWEDCRYDSDGTHSYEIVSNQSDIDLSTYCWGDNVSAAVFGSGGDLLIYALLPEGWYHFESISNDFDHIYVHIVSTDGLAADYCIYN